MGALLSTLWPMRGILRVQSVMRGLALVVAVVFFTFTIALVGGFLHSTTVADEATMENERNLLRNHIGVITRWTLAAQAVQLTWDDAMTNAGGMGRPLNVGWADTYIGGFLWNALQARQLFLVSPDGRVLRGWENGKPLSKERNVPALQGLGDDLAIMAANRSINGHPAYYRKLSDTSWPFSNAHRPMTRWASELGVYDGRPAIVTIVSLTPDADFSLLRATPNIVVAVRPLDEAQLAQFSSDLRLSAIRFSKVRPSDPMQNAIELFADGGASLGWLSWRPNLVGPIVIKRTIPLLAAYFAFFVAVLIGGIVLVRKAIRLSQEYATREARAQRSALLDPMLGLPNRTMVMQRLGRQLAEIQEAGRGEAVFVAYVDLDHFKAINDSIGHHIGDELLFAVVKRLRAAIGEGDLLGRLASDEFVVLHRGLGGWQTGEDLGKAIMSAFAEPFEFIGHRLTVSASCGISWAPDHGADGGELLRLADIALFRAKQRGRGRFRCFTPDMNATIRWRQDMEVELRRAILTNDLDMLYQPIVNLADRTVVCFEALLRWNHRDRGEISPAIFVPLAEQCGLMPQLGEWVLRRVFSDHYLFNGAEISVNLSPLQITASDFLPLIGDLVTEYGIDPRRFIFEITEGVLLDNSSQVLDRLGKIRDMGFRIALDDFGTGYSSLAYLRSFQFERIKVDRSFVQGIESDLDAQAILKTVVALGRTLRMKVVAEGVETILQQRLVEASGCELVQGHLYWRALPVERACEMAAGRKAEPVLMTG